MIFSGCTGWIYSGHASTIGTLGYSALVNGFDWDTIFILVLSWFTCWSFYWNSPLTGTLRGTTGGFAFLNISATVLNFSLSPFPSLNSGIAGAGFCSVKIILCGMKCCICAGHLRNVEFFGGNYTVSDILSARVLRVYDL